MCCVLAEFRKCAQTGWTRCGSVSPAKFFDHCQWRLQFGRLCAVCLAPLVHPAPSEDREARKLPGVRFQYASAPPSAKLQRLCHHWSRHCRYIAHGLHRIFSIPKTQVYRPCQNCTFKKIKYKIMNAKYLHRQYLGWKRADTMANVGNFPSAFTKFFS